MEHCHQALLLLPGRTSSGVRCPFFVGCHPAASFGCSARSDVAWVTFFPAQMGQPLPLVRLTTVASHSWDGSTEHCHQAFLLLPGTTSSGVKPPFLLGCHSAVRAGFTALR